MESEEKCWTRRRHCRGISLYCGAAATRKQRTHELEQQKAGQKDEEKRRPEDNEDATEQE